MVIPKEILDAIKTFQNNGFDVLYIPNFININQYPYLERKNITPKLLWVRSLHQIYNRHSDLPKS